jgi:hypothetical protein
MNQNQQLSVEEIKSFYFMLVGLQLFMSKGLVFRDDLFELGFNARCILFEGQFNKFFDLLIEQVKVVVIFSSQDEDLFMSGLGEVLNFPKGIIMD